MSCEKKYSSLANLSFNEVAFKSIISEITNSSGNSIPQPVMLIGESGSGKTILLNRIYNSEICSERSRVWIDGRYVFSSEEIIARATEKKAAIVFIDDVDFYFTRCDYDEQFRLRRFLYNENAPMMIASVSKILPAFTQYEAPFFEGLKDVFINPISLEDISHIYDGQDFSRASILMDLLPPTVKSLKTVDNIIRLNDSPENDIPVLLSMFSDKYKDVYQRLPTNSQHILNAFEGGSISMTIPELRAKTGLPTSILTSYLKNLRSQNIIKTDKSIRRNTKYFLRDSLFKLWLTKSVQEED